MVNKEVWEVTVSLRDLHDEPRQFSSYRIQNTENKYDKIRNGMTGGVDNQPAMALKVLSLHICRREWYEVIENEYMTFPLSVDSMLKMVTFGTSSTPFLYQGHSVVWPKQAQQGWWFISKSHLQENEERWRCDQGPTFVSYKNTLQFCKVGSIQHHPV